MMALIFTAISQGGRLLDYYEESPDQGRAKGNIYKGIIKNVDAHIQAAFVRYGGGRDGFLPLRDVPIRVGGTPPARDETSRSRNEAFPSGGDPAALAPPEKGGKRRRKGRAKGAKGGEAAAAALEAPKALGPGDAHVDVVVDAHVLGLADVGDLVPVSRRDLRSLVLRGIVEQEDLDPRIGLREQRVERLAQEPGTVEAGDDDRDERPGGHRSVSIRSRSRPISAWFLVS